MFRAIMFELQIQKTCVPLYYTSPDEILPLETLLEDLEFVVIEKEEFKNRAMSPTEVFPEDLDYQKNKETNQLYCFAKAYSFGVKNWGFTPIPP